MLSETGIRQRLTAILAADGAGYSRLMAADERGTLEALDAARGVFRSSIESHRGRVIDMAGDSVLAVFESAAGAVGAALEVQEQLDAQLALLAADRRMPFRIGIHLGDVIEKADGTVYGDGVNIASRLQALAEPGGITVSDAVQSALRQGLAASFDDLGEQVVKNIAKPVHVYRLRLDKPRLAMPPAASPAGPRDRVDKPAIAVLPFNNMSGDPEQEYFADGITEDIITELSRFRDLFVISRNSSFKYKGKAVEVQKFARELGVRYVVEGSVRKVGKRVRITVQLIDAQTDRHIWAERYDRELEDIFAIQDEVTSAIVATLPGRVEAAARDFASRKTTDNMAAYECVLAGKVHHHRSTREDAAQALRLLDRAIELDPGYASAHAWKACVLGQTWVYDWCEDRDATLKQVGEKLQTALALDDNDSDVHRILAAVQIAEDDLARARYHQQRALDAQSERRSHRRAARRAADLARATRRRHRVDPQGDAPEPLSPRALLESPRTRVLRRAALQRGDRRVQAHQRSRLPAPRVPGRVPRASRRRCGGERACARGAGARAILLGRQPPGDAALQERKRPRAPSRELAEGGVARVSPGRTTGAARKGVASRSDRSAVP